jgi:hypothetical protein
MIKVAMARTDEIFGTHSPCSRNCRLKPEPAIFSHVVGSSCGMSAESV